MHLESKLKSLLAERYALFPATLEPLHRFVSLDRGVYRLDTLGQPPRLVRATATGYERLHGAARVLEALTALGHPAPRVVRTVDKQLIAADDKFAVSVLSYTRRAVGSRR